MKINKPKRYYLKTTITYYQNNRVVDVNKIKYNKPWEKREYDNNGNKIYSIDSMGYWKKYVYDHQGNQIFSENVNGNWERYEYDNDGNEIYWENSEGLPYNIT